MNKVQRKRILSMYNDGVTRLSCIHMIISIERKKFQTKTKVEASFANPGEEGMVFTDNLIKKFDTFAADLAKEIEMFLQKTSDGRTCRI